MRYTLPQNCSIDNIFQNLLCSPQEAAENNYKIVVSKTKTYFSNENQSTILLEQPFHEHSSLLQYPLAKYQS